VLSVSHVVAVGGGGGGGGGGARALQVQHRVTEKRLSYRHSYVWLRESKMGVFGKAKERYIIVARNVLAVYDVHTENVHPKDPLFLEEIGTSCQVSEALPDPKYAGRFLDVRGDGGGQPLLTSGRARGGALASSPAPPPSSPGVVASLRLKTSDRHLELGFLSEVDQQSWFYHLQNLTGQLVFELPVKDDKLTSLFLYARRTCRRVPSRLVGRALNAARAPQRAEAACVQVAKLAGDQDGHSRAAD